MIATCVHKFRFNGCVAEQDGRVELSHALVRWLKTLLRYEMERVHMILLRYLPQEYRRKEMFSTTVRGLLDLVEGHYVWDAHWSREDVKVVASHFKGLAEGRSRGYIDSELEGKLIRIPFPSLKMYGAVEAFLGWLRVCTDEVEPNREYLVNWALGGDAARLM